MEGEKRKPITAKTGSKTFLKELLKRNFQDASSILLEMKGNEITKDFFKEHGFKSPILVRETSELGIKIPRVTDLNVLLKFLVPDLDEVDVIDVEKQNTFRMHVIEYFKYIMNPVKTRILNLISMEVSKTRLSEFIEAPRIVRDIDWIHCYWNRTKEGHKAYVPSSTEKYCLISPSKSFTDFHVDFSGTSVWYHIVSGVKDFFLIRPTSVNNHLFWKWSTSYHKEAQFFGDQVDDCYKLTIHAGETLLLPTGWIHAVYTPVDSLVYGGNFLTTYNAEEQFAVYEMELKEKVIEKYVHPHFRELNWFAAEGLCKEVDALLATSDILSVPCHMINAIKVALPHLKGWSTKMSVQEKSFFNCEQLFKDMHRILRLYEKAVAIRNTEKRESTRVKKRPNSEDFIRYEDFKIKRSKGQLELRSTPTHQGNVSEEDSSSDAWRVKTDTTKTLSVIIKRCSAIDSRVETPAATSAKGYQSDTPILKHRVDGSPTRLFIDDRRNSPTYRISTSPLRENSEIKNVYHFVTSSVSPSSTIICIKRSKDWSSIVPVTNDEAGPSSENPDSRAKSSSPEDPAAHSVHQDDEYIYPGLDFSDDEERQAHSSSSTEDKAWAPSSRTISVAAKKVRPQRFGKTKIAIEKGLEAAAAKPSYATPFPARKFIPPVKKPAPPKTKASNNAPIVPSATPSTSSSNSLKGKGKNQPSKKGSTAKQRLGKILKIHRMRQ